MIILYIYSLHDGLFVYSDEGGIADIIYDLGDDKDFTLTKPPNYDQPWYWIDNKWQSEPKPTPPLGGFFII